MIAQVPISQVLLALLSIMKSIILHLLAGNLFLIKDSRFSETDLYNPVSIPLGYLEFCFIKFTKYLPRFGIVARSA